jgi:hypothetical protein
MSHLSCDACCDDRQGCTIAKRPLGYGKLSIIISWVLIALIADQPTGIAAQVEHFAGLLKEYGVPNIRPQSRIKLEETVYVQCY